MDETREEEQLPKKKGLGSRHVQVLMLFLGMAVAYTLRVCMSVGVVAMTAKNSTHPDIPTYNWGANVTGPILSSFFWGYLVTQLPAGYIGTVGSAQKLLSIGIACSALLNMLVPVLAEHGGYVAVIVCRIAMGLSQGCLLPASQTLLSRWVPLGERARLGAFVMNGPQFGTVLAMPISGLLADSGAGWPGVFYFFGALGLAWSAAFYWIGVDYPSEHPSIDSRELEYINSCTGANDHTNVSIKSKVPWLKILTSVPIWSIIIVQSGFNWGFYTLLTELPNYMKSILDYDLTETGFVSAYPYLGMWLMGFPISVFADWAIVRGGLSTATTRKICNTVGLWLPALCMVVLCLVETDDSTVIVAIVVLAVGFQAGVTSGFQINHIDLSPNFAGTMMSLSNGFGNLTGLFAPIICGIITNNDEHNPAKWHLVFYITAAIYFVANLIFMIFGKASIQPWNEPKIKRKRELGQLPRLSIVSLGIEPIALAVPEDKKKEVDASLA
ncbi:hypothetical protein TKK_0003766 [Trichogramma kaykai]|uniref:Putative inorganic phosphate cotransporter n=1 Tax=Trichogramma kaykai TaxID=54128 RepID=A0ABD2XMJ5_9HYME